MHLAQLSEILGGIDQLASYANTRWLLLLLQTFDAKESL